MPSKSRAQHNLMAACSNRKGRAWAKKRGVKCPPMKTAKKFVKEDKGRFTKRKSRRKRK